MLKRFSEISMNNIPTCGGKGASLGEMMNAGLPIPNGFVLTTNAYGKNSKERENDVLQAFDKLNTKFVAVRSSGTKEDGEDDSFAGQFDTYLFVTKENLIEKIKECHDSVNSERIISYCDYKGIDRKSIKVAVVVQKMVNSDSAGVCFTVNPVSQNHDEIMIDAGFGVGEAVVSGVITPDNYIVNKKTGEIKKNISQQAKKLVLSDKGGTKEVEITEDEQSKQKLSNDNIKKLSELAVKIENHYGKPMDTERAVENGELYMLQARPITTLNSIEENNDIENISKKNWKKNREGNWSILSSYYFGLDYTVKATENIGIGFKETLFVSHKGRTISYILPEHKKNFGKFFENKLYQDETLIITRYNNAKTTTNEILEKISTLKNLPVNKENFENFIEALYKYGGRQRIMKHASDYWDSSLIDKNIKYLEKGRLLGEGVYVETENYMKYVCETLGKKYGIKTELIQAMTKKQFENLLYNGIITDTEILQNQFENFAFYISDSEFLSTSEKEKVSNIEKILQENKITNENIIYGNKAYGGNVKGKVRIILHPEENPKFEEGDILVTGMTRPEYLPYVKKSSAVITDAGGLLCHAAILAREIQKPCIIGTEIATKVLKDGDLVVVDADNGIVKILDRS